MKKFNHFLSVTLLAIILSVSVSVMGQNPFFVDVIQPDNTDIEWIIGHTYVISWTDNLTQPVDIKLWDPILGDYRDLASDVVGSTWSWEIGDQHTLTAASGFKIKVQSSVSASTYNNEGAIFELVNSLPGAINVLQPNVTGIDWGWNTTQLISWIDNVEEALDVYLVSANQSIDVKLNTTPVVGSTFSWDLNTTLGAGVNPPEDDDYYIRVQSSLYSSVNDPSNAPFSISQTTGTFKEIYQPNATTGSWGQSSTHLISWRDEIDEPIDIYVYDINDATIRYQLIGDNIVGSTFEWNLGTNHGTPNDAWDLGDEYKIRLVSSLDATLIMDSESFIIDETIGEISAIYQPLTTASWTLGTTQLISWLDNLNEPVDVYYRNWDPLPGGAHWNAWVLIDDDVVGTTVAWDIPTSLNPGVNYGQIKITSSIDGTVLKESEWFDLKLTQGSYINLIQPDIAGITWADGYDYYISWDDDLIDAEFVDIYLCGYKAATGLAEGDEFDTKEISLDNIGSTYVWTAGDEGIAGAESYRIKIVSSDNTAIVGYSEYTFDISLSLGTFITVENPTAGVYWMNNTDKWVSWIDNCPEDVFIYLDEYTSVGGSVASFDIDVTGVEGSMYSWYINQAVLTPTNKFKIRIESSLDEDLEGESAFFYIVPFGKSATSIDEDMASQVSLYPNPTTGQFSITAPASITKVEVRNLLGQVIHTDNVNDSQTSIDISNYDSGIYVVNVIVNDEVVTKKLFVQ